MNPRPPLRRRLSQSENTIGSSPERKFRTAADFVCHFAAYHDSSVESRSAAAEEVSE
nr:hypothetical protein JVH1_2240 [Rhodococcus sp. JVH1]